MKTQKISGWMCRNELSPANTKNPRQCWVSFHETEPEEIGAQWGSIHGTGTIFVVPPFKLKLGEKVKCEITIFRK